MAQRPDAITRQFFILFSAFLLYSFFQASYLEREQVYHETSENFVYKAENSGKYRLKIYTGYEFVGKIPEKEYIYNLKVGSKKVGFYDFYIFREKEIPEVSEVFSLSKNEIITTKFNLEFNSKVNRENIRADVRIVTEELRKGKWVEVHQVIFKERGPYWSLDKGPVETIRQGE